MHWSLKNPIGNYCISKFALVQPIFQNLSTAKKKFNSVDQTKTPTSIDLIESNYQFQTVVVCYPLKILTFNYDNFARRKWKQWWIKVFIPTPGLRGQTLNLNLVWYVFTHAQNYSWISHLKFSQYWWHVLQLFPKVYIYGFHGLTPEVIIMITSLPFKPVLFFNKHNTEFDCHSYHKNNLKIS